MNTTENITGTIIKVSGPVVTVEGMLGANMYDVVNVGDLKLLGEIIELRQDKAIVQVYEETSMLGPGESVSSTGSPLSVELGPGLMSNIFDGIQRPLEKLKAVSGTFLDRGVTSPSLDRERRWDYKSAVKAGDKVQPGDVLGTVQETPMIEHRVLVPPNLSGQVADISDGSHRVVDTVARLSTGGGDVELPMYHTWPVRQGRPYREKLPPTIPLLTGQRIFDTFFPLAKGGAAAIPGGFGTGKTVSQHQLAKWSDAQVVVYIGCGERGNEMTEVLQAFPRLQDPRSGRPLMERTVMIANTSNMPFAAREASIYTGITLAEYFRDMGYDVALMADSTSRWAEALREISGRLEEMPGEEGYPAYLSSRAAAFYERSGRVKTMGTADKMGSLSIVGAVSPAGGDFSEPVTQATLRIVKVFWGLDTKLAYQRHFPAINWLTSYSLYVDDVEEWWGANIDKRWHGLRAKALGLLQEESELQEIVRLVGLESLSPRDRLILETTKSLREDFLYQNAYHDIDTYASPAKQFGNLEMILNFHDSALGALDRGVGLADIIKLKVRDDISKARFVPEDQVKSTYSSIEKRIGKSFDLLIKKADDLERQYGTKGGGA